MDVFKIHTKLGDLHKHFDSNPITIDKYKMLNLLKSQNKVIIQLKGNTPSYTLDNLTCLEIISLILSSDSSTYIIYRGDNNNKFFCAGANLKSIENFKNYSFFQTSHYMCYLNFLESKRFIAIWNGVVMGGGLGMSIYSKFRISTETTKLAMPEVKFGLFANCFYFLFGTKILDYSTSLYFSLNSDVVTGLDVYKLGFSTHFILNKHLHKLYDYLENYSNLDETKLSIILNELQLLSLIEVNWNGNNERGPQNYKNYNLIKKYFNFDDFERLYNNLLIQNDIKDNEEKIFLEKIKGNILNRSYYVCWTMFYLNQLGFDKNISDLKKFDIEMDFAYRFDKIEQTQGINAIYIDKSGNPKWKYNSKIESEAAFKDLVSPKF